MSYGHGLRYVLSLAKASLRDKTRQSKHEGGCLQPGVLLQVSKQLLKSLVTMVVLKDAP